MVSFGDSDADSDWQICLVCDVPTLEEKKNKQKLPMKLLRQETLLGTQGRSCFPGYI